MEYKINTVGLFLGTERGYEALLALIRVKANIVCVLILQQDNHEIRNFSKKIEELCIAQNIPYDYSTKIKPISYKKYLLKYNPSAVFMIGWRFLVPEDCLKIPAKGMFVVHDSLLPKYRGIAPTTWPLINGEKETGLSLIYADIQMDEGDIVDQIKIDILENDTGYTMNNKYLKFIPEILLRNLDLILTGTNKRVAQDSTKATYGCKRTPEDGKIYFDKTTNEITRLIRALTYPYPGAFCFYKGEKIIIWEASEVKNPPKYVGRISGRIISVSKDGHVDVLTQDGVLRIEKIALPENPDNFLRPNVIFSSISQSLT